MNDDRWVSFDCYGTLVDWRSGMRDALASVAGKDAERLLRAYHDFEYTVETEDFRPYAYVLAESLRRAAARERVELPERGDEVLGQTLPHWPIFPDVADALGRLRELGWKLAILSNVDRDLIAGTLARMPVEFDMVITAQDVASYKPALAHFTTFRRRAEARPGQWAHVACSVFHDISPAKELAVPAIWIDREATGQLAPQADESLGDLTVLPGALEHVLPVIA